MVERGRIRCIVSCKVASEQAGYPASPAWCAPVSANRPRDCCVLNRAQPGESDAEHHATCADRASLRSFHTVQLGGGSSQSASTSHNAPPSSQSRMTAALARPLLAICTYGHRSPIRHTVAAGSLLEYPQSPVAPSVRVPTSDRGGGPDALANSGRCEQCKLLPVLFCVKVAHTVSSNQETLARISGERSLPAAVLSCTAV